MKHILHKLIYWYVERRCGGALHCYEYGPRGRYVEAMTDIEYPSLHQPCNIVRDWHLLVELQRRCHKRLAEATTSTDDEKLRDLYQQCADHMESRFALRRLEELE